MSASPSECAGSVLRTKVLRPSSANLMAIAALVLVLPTPPFPPTRMYLLPGKPTRRCKDESCTETRLEVSACIQVVDFLGLKAKGEKCALSCNPCFDIGVHREVNALALENVENASTALCVSVQILQAHKTTNKHVRLHLCGFDIPFSKICGWAAAPRQPSGALTLHCAPEPSSVVALLPSRGVRVLGTVTMVASKPWPGPGPGLETPTLHLPGHGFDATIHRSCLVQVGNDIELEAVGPHWQFEPSGYRWRPCGVTWDYSRTVVVIKPLSCC